MEEGRYRKDHINKSEEEKENFLAHIFHSIFMSKNMWQAVLQATVREGWGWGLLSGGFCTNTGITVEDVLLEKQPAMRVLPWKTPRAQPLRSTRSFWKR